MIDNESKEKPTEDDPSMDDILQSIRGVMADETTGDEETKEENTMSETIKEAEVVTPPKEAPGAKVSEEEVLELTEVAGNNKPEAEVVKAEAPAAEIPTEEKVDDAVSVAEAAMPDTVVTEEAPVSANAASEEAEKASAVETPAEDIAEAPMQDSAKEEAPTVKEESDTKAPATPAHELISAEAASVATSALKDLVTKATKPTSDGLAMRNGTTLEEIVVEVMKPQLSEWLDKNLPTIVKSIVEKEVRKLLPKDDD